jgi:protein-tyrosine-phosphatase
MSTSDSGLSSRPLAQPTPKLPATKAAEKKPDAKPPAQAETNQPPTTDPANPLVRVITPPESKSPDLKQPDPLSQSPEITAKKPDQPAADGRPSPTSVDATRSQVLASMVRPNGQPAVMASNTGSSPVTRLNAGSAGNPVTQERPRTTTPTARAATTASVTQQVVERRAEETRTSTTSGSAGQTGSAGNAGNSSTTSGTTDPYAESSGRLAGSAGLDTQVVDRAQRLGISAAQIQGMTQDQLNQAIRAVDLGLPYNASAADIQTRARETAQFRTNTTAAQADTAARTAVNAEVNQPANAAAKTAGQVREIPSGNASSPEREVAAQLRIDPNGKTPEQLRQEASARIARINGVDPTGKTTEQLSADNRRRSLTWLATQPNSGITTDPSDPNFSRYTYQQMIDGYRRVYNLPEGSTWADVMSAWQTQNPQRAQAAGLTESANDYYRRISGLTPARADSTASTTPNPNNGSYGLAAGRAEMNRANTTLNGADNPVRYTPQDAPKFNDAFGFARAEIESADTNRDGKLTAEELTAQAVRRREAYKLQTDNAYRAELLADNQKRLAALDVNRDGFIDISEQSAFVMLRDAPDSVFRTNIPLIVPKEQEAAALALLNNSDGRPITSAADGQITLDEAFATDNFLIKYPELTRILIEQTQQSLDLATKLKAWQDAGGAGP